MPETADYCCTVTLLLQDVTEETARQFFEDGAELEYCGQPLEGYVATVTDPGVVRAC